MPTPFLVIDLNTVVDRYAAFAAALPGVATFYAMKCNPGTDILGTLAALGAGFEVASIGELRMLQEIGVDPAEVLYSNPMKPPATSSRRTRPACGASASTPRASCASSPSSPPARPSTSGCASTTHQQLPAVPQVRRRGDEARDLLLLARELGLRPYGVTFHVGSQCANTGAWRQAIAAAGRLMAALATDGIGPGDARPRRRLPGPVRRARCPSIRARSPTAIVPALDELLPYRPDAARRRAGRHLVAESSGMVAAASSAARSAPGRTGSTSTSAPTTA